MSIAAELATNYRAARARLMGAPVVEAAPPKPKTEFRMLRPSWTLPPLEPSLAFQVGQAMRFAITREVAMARLSELTVRKIQNAVCAEYAVKLRDMLGPSRLAIFLMPRQVAMYLTRTVLKRSLPDIGRRFGGRDPSTAFHAIQKITALIDGNSELRERVQKITAALRERRGSHGL